MQAPLTWPPDAHDWPHSGRSRRVEAGGLRWHVQTSDGRGPTLLLLHGSGGSTHTWEALGPLLARRGYALLAPDLPGHAFTERPADARLTLRGFVELLEALLSVMDVQPDAVVGHSAGAAVALALAGRQPSVRAVVGLCPSLLSGREIPGGLLPDLLARSVRSPIAARVAAGLVRHTRGLDQVLASTGSAVPPAFADRYRTLTASADHVHSTLTLFSQWKPREVEAFLPRARTPCLLVAGAGDAWIPEEDVRRATELLPAGRMVTLDGVGHLAHEEAPAGVDAAMAPFLEEIFGITRPPPRPGGPPPPPPA